MRLGSDEEMSVANGRNRNLLWTVLMCLASTIVMVAVSIVYTGYTSRQNNRQWCDLMTTLDEAYAGPEQPQTPLGRKVAKAISELRDSFEC